MALQIPKVRAHYPRNLKPNSGPPTNDRALRYSIDGLHWCALNPGLSEVTGRINRGTTGFWFERLEEITYGEIDVRCFSKLNGGSFGGFQIHESAYPVHRISAVGRKGCQVLAAGELGPPFEKDQQRRATVPLQRSSSPAISLTRSTMRRRSLASLSRMNALVRASPSEVARKSDT